MINTSKSCPSMTSRSSWLSLGSAAHTETSASPSGRRDHHFSRVFADRGQQERPASQSVRRQQPGCAPESSCPARPWDRLRAPFGVSRHVIQAALPRTWADHRPSCWLLSKPEPSSGFAASCRHPCFSWCPLNLTSVRGVTVPHFFGKPMPAERRPQSAYSRHLLRGCLTAFLS